MLCIQQYLSNRRLSESRRKSKTKQEATGLKILYKAQVMYVRTYIYVVVVVEVPRLGDFFKK